MKRSFACLLVAAAMLGFHRQDHGVRAQDPPQKVDFVRSVFPILQQRCFSCHGPDEQESLLRLDGRRYLLRGGVSGPALRPAKPAQSLMYQRLITSDVEKRMPLDEEPLSAAEIDLIRSWIEEGASWPGEIGESADQHWSYRKPVRPPLPAVKNSAWPRNHIDYFVLSRLEQEGRKPSVAAKPARLIRRLYLDLIGLPPTVEQVDEFLLDPTDEAYVRIVDRLLASPHYGEHWARHWLDLARYADSNGYQADQFRSVWPYRDWVISALNSDMPFDQFTVHQLAGDLLPDADLHSKIASGFHRLTTCNVEAGVDPEENRVEQIIDRVNTTGTIWLGSSVECAQCHNHPYDPYSTRDYYQLFAFFNNTPLEVEGDGVTYNFVGPRMDLPYSGEDRQRRERLQSRLAELDQQLKESDALASPQRPEGEAKPAEHREEDATVLEQQPAVAQLRERIDGLRKQLANIKPATTLVMVEMRTPRENHILLRGNFQNKGDAVQMRTVASLHAQDAPSPKNRLGLAQWLVDEDNPLVARVTVNRWWAGFFGAGIVTTAEDFGTRGEPPSHPLLLDWLATEFMRAGWSMKHIHKLIVTSATYRQSSKVAAAAFEADPQNRLLSRGPRFRLSAEMVRDNALVASGLFSPRLGGPPVFPPQPEGIWRHVGRNAPKYQTSPGDDRFCRGIYVVWRRSAPYASFVNFDAPDRSSCVVQRPRTNTPLQALTLLNDPAYVEMAVALARRMLLDREELSQRVDYGFRRCLARQPTDRERQHLEEVFRQELRRFQAAPQAARQLLAGYNAPTCHAPEEMAACFVVANILLNLDEMITKG